MMSPGRILQAQGIPPLIDGPGLNALSRELALSREQTQRIESLRNKFYRDSRALRYEILTKRLEMRRLFADPTTDKGTITARERDLAASWQRLADLLSRAAIDARQVLNPEQIEKLERLSAP